MAVSVFDVSGVELQDVVSERLVVEMGIYLCGADAGMSQQCLYDAEVGASAQQCGGKGVAQGVGRYVFGDSCGLGLPFDHDEYHGAREVMAAPVEKHEVFFARLDGHLAAVVKPKVQFADCPVGDGHKPFLVAFAQHAYELFGKKEVGKFQMGEFGDTQSAREKHLDDGPVAVTLAHGEVYARFQSVHFFGGEIFGQVLWEEWRLQKFGGVYLQIAVCDEETVECTHAAEDACLRLCTYAVLVYGGCKVLQVFEFHLQWCHVSATEVVEEPVEVVEIGLQRIGRVTALQFQVSGVTPDDGREFVLVHRVVGVSVRQNN